ncbi:MAG: nucleotidyltransferase domain-containing protein [Synechococcaceae cyanobacterium]|nr:nucleotidyltransferase domain-containing protein [Synechococcaceae cyanobacterium]
MGIHGLEAWRRRFSADRKAIERRRIAGLRQARRTAAALRVLWPGIRQIWLFGSLLTPGFHGDSDLDLLLEGLPAEALIEAAAVAERSGPLAPDLKRSEDLDPELRQRLQRGARPLLHVPAPIGGGDAP